jgi:AraC-like DNA-binding protein
MSKFLLSETIMKPLNYFPILIIFFCSFPNISCNNEKDSIHVKNWKILYEQNESLETVIQKNGWENISIPSVFKLPNPAVKGFQYIWLRGELTIEDNPSSYYGLSTGRIRLADKIFINSHLIGSLSSKKVNWNPVPRNYIIPKGILKKGNNMVYIHLGVYGNEFGGISDDVIIEKENEFNTSGLSNALIYDKLPFGILIMYLGFMMETLFSYFWNRKEKFYIYFSLILFILSIFIFINLPSFKFLNFELFHALRILCLVTGSVFTILAIQSIYRLYLSDYNRIIIPLLLASALTIILSSSSIYFQEISFFITILNHIILIPFFIFIIYQLNLYKKLNPERYDKFLIYSNIASLILCCFLIIFETWLNSTGGHLTGFFATFLTPVAILFFAIYTAREIMNRKVELELLYDKLKSYNRSTKDISITDASEEKLKRVIEFIDENYSQDISREGLAAAVGINPSYMGTLFKTYKSITINEYINKLRIDEAIKQLEQSKMRIIDIAFSVGFENNVSFNRVFKRITGMTPSEYRKSKKSAIINKPTI